MVGSPPLFAEPEPLAQRPVALACPAGPPYLAQDEEDELDDEDESFDEDWDEEDADADADADEDEDEEDVEEDDEETWQVRRV